MRGGLWIARFGNRPHDRMGAFFDIVGAIIAPRVCAGCEREGSWLCSACIGAIAWDANVTCIGCDRIARWGTTCDSCRRALPIDGVLAMTRFDAPAIRRLIHLVKYTPARDAAGAFVPLVNAWAAREGSAVRAEAWGAAPLIVPVPLHRRRERERGFNQSAILASALASQLGAPIVSALARPRATLPQAELDRARRLGNVAGAFVCDDGTAITGRAVLLVDDVVTTGATLAACARVLRASGARTVWGFALARG